MSLSIAIRKTQAYARFFHSTLSPEELHHWLISDKIYSSEAINKLSPKTALKKNIPTKKLKLAQKVAKTLSLIPTIKLVALTGSFAANNAKKKDDIDLFIVTSAHTLWLTRPICLLFPKIFCFNLWLDESALSVPQSKHTLYTAHEILQAKPLFDRTNIYAKFIYSNPWTQKYLANAYQIATSNLIKNSPILDTRYYILNTLNRLAFFLQYQYMKRKITNETITLHSAYFHPRNPSKDVESYISK